MSGGPPLLAADISLALRLCEAFAGTPQATTVSHPQKEGERLHKDPPDHGGHSDQVQVHVHARSPPWDALDTPLNVT